MKILITGITGFVGSHFVDYLSQSQPEVEIHGTVLPNQATNEVFGQNQKVVLHPCDINEKFEIRRLIMELKPDKIFHLAAQSYVSSSWENPELTLHTNIIGQSNLFEAVRHLRDKDFDPVILIAGSSEEYGPAKDGEVPFTENSELRPQSPYAISKIAQDFMGFQYWKSYEMKIIRIRAFNHTGPRRDSVFGISGFAKKIAEIEKNILPPQIETRDLSAVRDFTDVRDVVRAYFLAAEKCQPGEVYNICSSIGFSFKEILDKLLNFSTMKNIKVISDPQGLRPTDGGKIIGDNSKFKLATGWQPEIDFLNQTLLDMLNYWREKL
ncbi:MAG: GDP-mannose 4,6-dehydratase [Patescibacteria group bacterium]|jgi:GDP-4-dehydro-6-deoxy-D-mannose reductase